MSAAPLLPPEGLEAAHAALWDRADAFARESLPALAEAHAPGPELAREVARASREAGLFGLTQPESHGGTAADALALTLVRERIAATALPARHHVFGPGPGMLAAGGPAVAERWLAPLLRGERRTAFAFTDAPGARTVARRADGGWRLDGTKGFVTGGADADFFTVVAQLAEGDGDGAIAVVLDADAPGLTRSAPFRSLDGTRHVALTFADTPVADEAVLGAPGEGLPRALRQIGDVRLAVAAEACGLMAFTLAHLEARLRAPHRSGAPLGDREGVRLRFADARIDAFAARSMLYRTARLVDAGENAVNETIATKVFATEAAGRVVDAALQLEGAGALVEGHPLERLYREVRALRFAEGASDVLRLGLARGRLELEKGRL
ncbi:MAG: acyl-CoA dehydrogenase family protein [Pseudomonadales bacterium]|jgi:alkylation response protein AidB-like acyl-CoA dehydrogenase|nr:acyl-CoA dehydrogenase family protein [Pseudomonadales bacterium]